MTIDEQLAYLTKGCVDVVRAGGTARQTRAVRKTGKPLMVKVGFDPTAPDLHLGHTVLIRKMKHFQDLGHRVIFLVGDFTGLIGDPTGTIEDASAADARGDRRRTRRRTRRRSSRSSIRDKTVVRFNCAGWSRSAWLGDAGGAYNVAQMLERERLQVALRHRQADRHPRVPLPARAGLRLGVSRSATSRWAAPTSSST